MKTTLSLVLAAALLATPAMADHNHTAFDPDFPISEALADGHGKVHVKIVHHANESCWKIAEARQGVLDPAAYQTTDRLLYITVLIASTGTPCEQTGVPLQTALIIDDAPGTLSLDIFFVDDRGVLTRSQRHRILRDL